MIEQKKYTVLDRLRIWQELLTQAEGTTYKKFLGYTNGEITLDTAKSDISIIKKIVRLGGGEFISDGKKNKVFMIHSLDSTLEELYKQYMKSKPYSSLLELLTHMKGVFPNQFFNDLYTSFDDIVSKREETSQVISFDTNTEIIDNMKYFSRLYTHIINRKPLSLIVHRINDSNIQENFVLLPEYLKQYHSLWYVFGPAFNGEDQPIGICKIRLDLIDRVKVSTKKITPSGINYEEYFSQIIGLENYDKGEIMHIVFLISNRMYNRLCNNPLHISQKLLPSTTDSKGYKTMSIDVKKNIELIRNILNLGSDIIILSPLKLRKEIKKEIQKTLKNYE